VEVTAAAAAAAVKATAAARTVKRIADTANPINRSVSSLMSPFTEFGLK
jgi:hypothetical protein